MKYPATLIVHTVNGSEPCCINHADKLIRVMNFLGAGARVDCADDATECNNCRNEAEKAGGKP